MKNKNAKSRRKKMEPTREQVIEAIQGICNYDTKLITACQDIIDDLKAEKLSLLSNVMQYIIQGINWTVEVLNRTIDTFNEGTERLNKEELNSALVSFSTAYESGNGEKVAEAIQNAIIPFLHKVCEAGKEVANQS